MFRLALVASILAVTSAAWKRASHNRFSNATVADIKRLLGTVVGENAFHLPVKTSASPEMVNKLPTEFDSRVNWADCSDVIGLGKDCFMRKKFSRIYFALLSS